MTWVLLNDRLVAAAEACVSVFDRGFMYGDGVFETLRAYRGHPFRLAAHLDRLQASASAIRLDLPYPSERMAADIRTVLTRNDLDGVDAVVRVSVSRGRGARGPSLAGVSNPTYVVTAEPVPESVVDRRTAGVRLGIVNTRRVSGRALPTHAKHANYLNAILAHAEATAAGADDGLLLDSSGKVAECTGSNIFLVNGARLLTPDLKTGILPGITRELVLEICASNGFSADQARIDPAVLDDVEEVFITNSVSELVPVRAVDGRAYPVPGPVTAMLQDLYRRAVEAEMRGPE